MSKALNQSTGKFGERSGETYLKKQGYRILARNLKSPFGEIDLVANDRGTLVFVEVKTRKDAGFGFPEEAVTREKRNRLIRLASWYLMQHPKLQSPVRFDVLAVEVGDEKPEFRLIQNAFELEA